MSDKIIRTAYEHHACLYTNLFDWRAWYDGTEGDFLGVIGYGKTEQEAIEDLKGV